MKPMWFKDNVAYTMAKYGMSMCVLGMSEEFKDAGIAVNALWPQTAIITAAMEMLGGKDVAKMCRKPEIMSDAAYVILTRDKSFTANHEKTKTLPLKHQKTILNFDATFAKATNDVVAVVIATALGNQKTQLLNHVSEKAATIQNASQRMRMSLASRRVAKETVNLEKTKTLPRKHQ